MGGFLQGEHIRLAEILHTSVSIIQVEVGSQRAKESINQPVVERNDDWNHKAVGVEPRGRLLDNAHRTRNGLAVAIIRDVC